MSVARIPVDGGPYAVHVDAGRAVWTTLVHAGRVARVDPSGAVALFDAGAQPMLLAPGPDGAVWCTRSGDDRISPVERPDAGVALPTGSRPYGLAAGPGGTLWCTAYGSGTVGRVDGARCTLWPVAGMPSAITAVGDGAWFTLNTAGALGHVSADGAVAVHPLPDPACGPVGIAADGDALWFTEILADRIGRRDADGAVHEFPVPAGARPHAVVPDGAGGCWATLWGAAALAHVDGGGAVEVVARFDGGDEPHGLAVAGDGVWVALESGFLARVAP